MLIHCKKAPSVLTMTHKAGMASGPFECKPCNWSRRTLKCLYRAISLNCTDKCKKQFKYHKNYKLHDHLPVARDFHCNSAKVECIFAATLSNKPLPSVARYYPCKLVKIECPIAGAPSNKLQSLWSLACRSMLSLHLCRDKDRALYRCGLQKKLLSSQSLWSLEIITETRQR